MTGCGQVQWGALLDCLPWEEGDTAMESRRCLSTCVDIYISSCDQGAVVTVQPPRHGLAAGVRAGAGGDLHLPAAHQPGLL